jgi:hypothetical protein
MILSDDGSRKVTIRSEEQWENAPTSMDSTVRGIMIEVIPEDTKLFPSIDTNAVDLERSHVVKLVQEAKHSCPRILIPFGRTMEITPVAAKQRFLIDLSFEPSGKITLFSETQL